MLYNTILHMTYGIGSKPVAKSGGGNTYFLSDSPSLFCFKKRMLYAEKEMRESGRKNDAAKCRKGS